MTDIEKRANSYIGHPFDVDEDSCITTARIGYKNGATDQQNIDIEKGEAFCKKWLDEIINIYLPELKDEPFYTQAHEHIRTKFKQAMEE